MLYGIGTDIIEITRIKNAKQSFLQKTFTEQELDYFYQKGSRPETLAAMFAAKEAAAKAIGTGFRGFLPIDIEVLHDEKPSKKLASLLEQMEIKAQFQLSLSHCQEYAVAFVILHQA